MQTDAITLLNQLQSPDADVRYSAWRSAGPVGPSAIEGIGVLMASPDRGIARAARGALESVVHYAARPGASSEAAAASKALLKVALSVTTVSVRADALHMLGYVGDGRIAPGLAKLLDDVDVRDETRMALERIPGGAALNALRQAQRTVPDDFKPSIAQSLRNRMLTPLTVGIRSDV